MNNAEQRHIPPQSIEAEMSVLGSVFIDNPSINTALEIITADDFYRETHRKIFRGMLNLHESKTPIDFVTMTDALKRRGELEEIGGAAYLLTLTDYTPTAVHIASYARIVKEKSVARKTLTISRDMQTRIQNGQDPAETIDEARRTLDTLSNEADAIYGVDADELIDFNERHRQYLRHIKRVDEFRFITGLLPLDKALRGVLPGEVMTIAAYSGTFKSALLQYLLLRSARETGLYSLLFSLEMPAVKLFEREASMQSGVNGFTIEYKWKNEPTSAEDIHRKCREGGSNRLIICERPRLTIEQIARYIDATRRKYGEIGAVGIDYLGLMAAPGKTLFERTAYLCPELKNLAKAKNVPLVVLSQVSRDSIKHNAEIEAHSAKGGGDVEASADFMLGLYQDKDNQLVLKILKNRNGMAGESFQVNIDKPSLQFKGLSTYAHAQSRRSGNGIEI
jgi:replicative DNA helicase